MAKKELVIVTGMSGAGKTVAMKAFEDLGYFTAQNLPANLLPQVWQMISNEPNIERAAIMIDTRSRQFFEDLGEELFEMSQDNHDDYNLRVLFLDADDKELVARYKETRRQHPLAGDKGTLAGLEVERKLMADVRNIATDVIDTSQLDAKGLRQVIVTKFGSERDHQTAFSVQVMSFGFKYGLPADADIVEDVRFLTNPYYQPELREQTGLNQPVWDYVWNDPDAEKMYQMDYERFKWLLPRYKAEGKSSLTIAYGCTGGQHRSVAFAHRLAQDLSKDWVVNENHRDKDRRKAGYAQ
ncbi:nucleotide-binding protein [Weissella viridescens]|uniref:GlmZ(SRNA)-inactivating NTPase n=1 Tax=Weissella viridescens TaxID=1629 RepID=A0A0R2HAC6_WEIVI|nr:RNase adapter RapZ [Weissella viridescens]KRN46500.1 glmZ(sRNA)-inactivating NTPase [Weissella viridescens]GEA94878.1 nucleotide-binding protein [Weissella viridescens]